MKGTESMELHIGKYDNLLSVATNGKVKNNKTLKNALVDVNLNPTNSYTFSVKKDIEGRSFDFYFKRCDETEYYLYRLHIIA